MRFRRAAIASAVVIAAIGIWSASAAGATRTVPPGVSGATQYTETLPGPGGEESTRQIGVEQRETSTDAAEKLGARNAGRLEGLGPEGKAAAKLAAAGVTGSSGGGSSPGRGGGAAAGTAGGGAEPSGSSPVGQLLGQVTGTSDSQGMGALLPLLIVAAALVAIGYLIGRRRIARTHD